MRCRFCDTEIAATALVCFRCGRATSDPRVAPPAARRGPTTVVMAATVLLSGIVAAYLPAMADGAVVWTGWVGLATLAAATAGAWWRGRA